MEILKFENSPRPARKKSSSSKIILGFASVAAVAMLGSTLAASITLNGSDDVEFGQGVAQTTACDSTIFVTPVSAFNNSTSAFELTSIELSSVDDDSCAGKLFTLNAYTSAGSSPIPGSPYTFIYDAVTPGANASVFSVSFNGDSSTATVALQTPLNLTSDDVAKLTLETSD